jgi:hypothetical protein
MLKDISGGNWMLSCWVWLGEGVHSIGVINSVVEVESKSKLDKEDVMLDLVFVLLYVLRRLY